MKIQSHPRSRVRAFLVKLLLALLLAIIVWVLLTAIVDAAAPPPTRYPVLCHRSQYGVRVQFFTLKSTYQLHRWGHDDEPATWNIRYQQWECN